MANTYIIVHADANTIEVLEVWDYEQDQYKMASRRTWDFPGTCEADDPYMLAQRRDANSYAIALAERNGKTCKTFPQHNTHDYLD